MLDSYQFIKPVNLQAASDFLGYVKIIQMSFFACFSPGGGGGTAIYGLYRYVPL